MDFNICIFLCLYNLYIINPSSVSRDSYFKNDGILDIIFISILHSSHYLFFISY